MKTKKTVVHLIQSLGRGGCEKMLLDILPPLHEKGWENVVITLQSDGALESYYREAGIQLFTIHLKSFFDIRALFRLRALLHSIQPSLICTYLLRADILGRFFLPFFSFAPVIPHLVTTYNHPRYRVARFFEWSTRFLVKYYLANSTVIKDYYEKQLHVRKGKIFAIASGIDSNVFKNAIESKIREELNISPRDIVIVCVANLASNKGQHFLLDAFEIAFRKNPHVFLLIVGEGQNRENLFSQRNQLESKERILFLGRRGDVPDILAGSDIFVLPTLFEGMSIALLEAMASGKAIITTDIPENRPLFPDDRFARLVPPKDITSLAQEMIRLSQDPSLRLSLSRQTKDRVEKCFSLNAQVLQLDTIFHFFTEKNPVKTPVLFKKTEKPKILHIIQSLGNGGCENSLLRILPALHNYEHRIITLKELGPLAEKFSQNGIIVKTANMKNLFSWRSYKTLSDETRDFSPDIIITYLVHADIIGRLFLQKKFKITVVPFLRTTYNYPKYRLVRIFEWLTKPMVKRYLANSEAVKNFYIKRIGVPSKKITVIPNGIDTTIYENANGSKIFQEFHLPEKSFVITCVANLAENKGHSYLLEAFERIFNAHKKESVFLLLVGDGNEKKTLQTQVEKYRSKNNIFFLGYRTDIPEILKASNCFVLPTLFEGMSNAILEAMASGLPIITTDIPENRELIIHKKNGLLCRTKNTSCLVRSIEYILKNPHAGKVLGKNSHQNILDKHDFQKRFDCWNKFLEETLSA